MAGEILIMDFTRIDKGSAMASSQVNTVNTGYQAYRDVAPADASGTTSAQNVISGAVTAEVRPSHVSTQVAISTQARQSLSQENEADSAREGIVHRLGKMKEALDAIVKQYPPYRTEDKRRQEYLELFSGLRKEIESIAPETRSLQEGKPTHQLPQLGPRAADQDVALAARTVDSLLTAISR